MKESDQGLKDRIALITGASRGIGAAVAKAYAAQGAQCVLVARDTGRLEEVDDAIRAAGGLAPVLVPLDLADAERIDSLGPALLERFGRLDVLVGNAALLGDMTPVSHMVPKVFDKVMAVNVTANYRLIRILEPLLRRSQAGRAIFVTSGVTQAHYPYWGGYAVSKAALEMLALTWAEEVRETGLKVNLVDPGAVRTAMRAAAFPGEDPQTLPPPEEITALFVQLAGVSCTHHGQRLHV